MGNGSNDLDGQIAKQGRSEPATTEHTAMEVLESMTEAFVAIDREWRYTYVNSAAERIVGLRREQMLG